MPERRLPAGRANVFQVVRQKRQEAQAQGMTLFDLSIGEPKGPALLSAREAAAREIMSEAEAMHAYQYNLDTAVPDFSKRFVTAHLGREVAGEDVAYLPIAGIKPILGLLPLACGCATDRVGVATMTAPGYPIPADWCAYHPHAEHQPLPLNVKNQFLFAPEEIPANTDLIMTNYPHNPSGQVADEDWMRTLCAHCQANGIRLFNDAAYICLSHTDDNTSLAEVAGDYPDLSWAEAYTAAKLIGNGTGWHVGAVVGSADFIADLGEVKGKTDAGYVPAMAAGVIEALENDQDGITVYRKMYEERLAILINLLADHGMRLALEPRAGFYTLWQSPTRAFGRKMESAMDFNMAMIEETGVVGVHFGDYLRYAVCADVTTMTDGLNAAFEKAAVRYD